MSLCVLRLRHQCPPPVCRGRTGVQKVQTLSSSCRSVHPIRGAVRTRIWTRPAGSAGHVKMFLTLSDTSQTQEVQRELLLQSVGPASPRGHMSSGWTVDKPGRRVHCKPTEPAHTNFNFLNSDKVRIKRSLVSGLSNLQQAAQSCVATTS